MSNPIAQIAVGALLLVVAAVMVFTTLPTANEAIDDYAAGTDGTLGNTDDPPTSQVSMAHLFPFGIIAGLTLGGIAFLVSAGRSIKTGN